jgi:TonB family protein
MDEALAHPAETISRWAAAAPDRYASRVRPGNVTALNLAQVPFARYLNDMHWRIHPLFADRAVAWWEKHGRSLRLKTRLEIVLTADGAIAALGVVHSSGDPLLDALALESVSLAAPFGSTPGAIRSADGRVYAHWELQSDEVFACSTMGARPFLLANAP